MRVPRLDLKECKSTRDDCVSRRIQHKYLLTKVLRRRVGAIEFDEKT
jgi:hypothetical protein